MAYTVADITELIHYHLVLSVDDEVAQLNLAKLIHCIDQLLANPPYDEPAYWMACEQCGTWVSSELIGPDGAGKAANGGFYCTSCRFGDDEQ
jgi:hypothetical protein